MIEIANDLFRRPRGIVRLYVSNEEESREEESRKGKHAEDLKSSAPRSRPPASCAKNLKMPAGRRGKLIYEADNLYVNSGLTVLANLLGAGTAGYIAAAVGFGSGNPAPALTDTDLTSAPKYYNAIGTHTIGPAGGIAAGSVLFNYALATTDYAANPLTIQELGLFANTSPVILPALVGGTFSAWQSAHAYSLGNLIVDSNGNIQRVTTAGTSGGSAPSWSTTMGGTTTDSTVIWTVVALHTAPGPMIAHVVVPSFPYTGAGNYSGTWTISM
jgi:hypothetical protein